MRALAEARALGFLGPGPLDEHLASAARFADALVAARTEGPALDLGSGGGVPGLPLAEWFPAWEWVLFDAQRRRTSFLAAATAAASLAPRVRAVRGRAEEVGHDPAHREVYGVVTVRSFGPPAATAEAATGLVRVGGHVVIAEPPDGVDRWDRDGLARLSLRVARRGGGVVTLEKVAPAGEDVPRPVRSQRKAPLF